MREPCLICGVSMPVDCIDDYCAVCAATCDVAPGAPVLDVLERFYMDGMADGVTGDVESSVGHWYRVGFFLVHTDSQGFREVVRCDSEFEAGSLFGRIDTMYGAWLDEVEA